MVIRELIRQKGKDGVSWGKVWNILSPILPNNFGGIFTLMDAFVYFAIGTWYITYAGTGLGADGVPEVVLGISSSLYGGLFLWSAGACAYAAIGHQSPSSHWVALLSFPYLLHFVIVVSLTDDYSPSILASVYVLVMFGKTQAMVFALYLFNARIEQLITIKADESNATVEDVMITAQLLKEG